MLRGLEVGVFGRGNEKMELMTVVKLPSGVFLGGLCLYLVYSLFLDGITSNLVSPVISSFPKLVSSKFSLDNLIYSNESSDSILNGKIRNMSRVSGLVTYRAIIDENVTFNMSDSDVMVLLHIQKTGGTSFEKHIVNDLIIERPCVCWKRRKRCTCPRPKKNKGSKRNTLKRRDKMETWLFSRFSTGWACGLHADWTELTSCVDDEIHKAHGTPTQRRYFYITMVRDPVHRFLSEFRHVQRGATWKNSKHFCDGRYATFEELGKCYQGEDWSRVTLDEFLECPHNLAFNRQTRMLADLTLVGCYNKSVMPEKERNKILVASAKYNLQSMAFVGLTEFQRLSQYIFEETFQMKFLAPFIQNQDTYSKATMDQATDEQLERVRRGNSLDIEIYSYAQQMLHNRLVELKEKDPDFEEHYRDLNRLDNSHFSWNDIENEQ